MSHVLQHRTATIIAALLAILILPLAMGPGCIPGTGQLPFDRFDYEARWGVGCNPPTLVAKASIQRLDNGWYILDMSVFNTSPIPLFCDATFDGQCVVSGTHVLPTRLLDDADLQQIADVFANIEIITGYKPPAPCAIDPCSSVTYEWGNQIYASYAGLCPNGEYTTLSNDSQVAIQSLMESFR